MPVRIDRSRCTGCGRCIERCGNFVFKRLSETLVLPVSVHRCAECTLCVSGCPQHAIRLSFHRPQNQTHFR